MDFVEGKTLIGDALFGSVDKFELSEDNGLEESLFNAYNISKVNS